MARQVSCFEFRIYYSLPGIILLKFLIKTVCILVFSLIVVLLVEFGCFYRVLNKNQSPSPADAVVVFHGSEIRNKVGYRLANEGLAPLMIVSPADDSTRQRYDKIYNRTGSWQHLVEDRADTTFQNALFAGRLIREHNLKKVILVTDSWHMPRSYLLLRAMLTGADVDIFPVKTDSESYGKSPVNWSTHQKKRVYNELVEFWGSVCEWALYAAHGKLPERSLNERRWVKVLRGVFLVEVG